MTWVKMTTWLNVADTQVFSKMNAFIIIESLTRAIPGLVAIDDMNIVSEGSHIPVAPINLALQTPSVPTFLNSRQDTYRRMEPTHDMATPRAVAPKVSPGEPKCRVCNRKADLRIVWPDNKHHGEMYCTVLHMSQRIGHRRWWAQPENAQGIREVVIK